MQWSLGAKIQNSKHFKCEKLHPNYATCQLKIILSTPKLSNSLVVKTTRNYSYEPTTKLPRLLKHISGFNSDFSNDSFLCSCFKNVINECNQSSFWAIFSRHEYTSPISTPTPKFESSTINVAIFKRFEDAELYNNSWPVNNFVGKAKPATLFLLFCFRLPWYSKDAFCLVSLKVSYCLLLLLHLGQQNYVTSCKLVPVSHDWLAK